MDDLIEKCGAFGIYQKVILGIISFVTALNGYSQFMSIFNTAVPKLLCSNKNDNLTIASDHSKFLHNSCDAFSNITSSQLTQTETPYKCLYDNTHYGLTIVNEFSLVCEKMHLAGLTQTFYMIGSLCSIVNGFLSDKYGRKTICYSMSLLLCSAILLCELFQLGIFGFSDEIKYWIYVTTSFFLGFTVYSLDIITYVLLIELTTPAHSNFISIFNIIMYVIGQLVLLVFAYYFRNWRYQSRFSGLWAFAASLQIIFILPESPR